MLEDRDHTDSPNSAGEAVDVSPPSAKAAHRSGGRRTHRACDRCRVKKSKCNGQQPCNTCKANERTCVFSALRRRDIRKWHCHMQDTVDEAIQRLYRACKECACFPGTLPEERDGYVTTEQILHGMGFSNLDLGPRSGGVPGLNPLQILPVRPHFQNILAEPGAVLDAHMHNDQHANHNSRSNLGPINTAAPGAPPDTQAGYHAMHIMHDRYIGRPPTPSLNMSDQFLEAIREPGQPQDDHPQHVSHQHYHTVFPHPPQHVTHDVHVGRPDTSPDGHTQLLHASSFSRNPYYRAPYPTQQCMMYDRDSLMNLQQIWVGSTEIPAGSQ